MDLHEYRGMTEMFSVVILLSEGITAFLMNVCHIVRPGSDSKSTSCDHNSSETGDFLGHDERFVKVLR